MKSRMLVAVVMALMLVCVTAQAQTPSLGSGTLFTQPKGFLDALFDKSRFTMSHSYTMTVGSVGKYGFNQGLYLNTMQWRLADPLFMQIRLGYAHQPFGQSALFGESQAAGQFFVQQAYLEYKPFKNATLSLEFQSVPSSMTMTAPFGLSGVR